MFKLISPVNLFIRFVGLYAIKNFFFLLAFIIILACFICNQIIFKLHYLSAFIHPAQPSCPAEPVVFAAQHVQADLCGLLLRCISGGIVCNDPLPLYPLGTLRLVLLLGGFAASGTHVCFADRET